VAACSKKSLKIPLDLVTFYGTVLNGNIGVRLFAAAFPCDLTLLKRFRMNTYENTPGGWGYSPLPHDRPEPSVAAAAEVATVGQHYRQASQHSNLALRARVHQPALRPK
jgi:hypothetical protein